LHLVTHANFTALCVIAAFDQLLQCARKRFYVGTPVYQIIIIIYLFAIKAHVIMTIHM